jgi:hypothetical protein
MMTPTDMFLAYLDPGSGSIMLQLLFGGVAGLAVLARLYGRRIASTLGWRRQRTEEHSASAASHGRQTPP